MDSNDKIPLKAVNRDLKSKSGLPKPSLLKPPTPVGKKRPASSPEKLSEQANKRPKVAPFNTGVNGVSKPHPNKNSGMTRAVSASRLNGVTTENGRTNGASRGLVKAPSLNSIATNTKPPPAIKTNGLSKPKSNVNGQRIPTTKSKIMVQPGKKNLNVVKKPPTKEEIIARMQVEQADLMDQKQSLEMNIDGLNAENSKLLDDLDSEKEVSAKIAKQLENLKELNRKMEETLEHTQHDLRMEKSTRRNVEYELSHEQDVTKNLNRKVGDLETVIDDLKNNLMRKEAEHEAERRILHNTIQELKGNIRVFCRVRPLLPKEADVMGGSIHHLNFPEPKSIEVNRLDHINLNESSVNAKNKYTFNFDNVFDPSMTQEKVFHEVSQLVQSSLDGYNVCIFAYGQTGSGKTFTMEGGNSNDTMGMIPRSMMQIFEAVEPLKARGWNYEFIASMLEIYNESVHDLLADDDTNLKYEIKMTSKEEGGVYVNNLKLFPVNCQEEVHKLLRLANSKRSVAETKCNARSSRSHSVFQLRIKGNNQITHENCAGTLNLIDLAGSERLKLSGSEGQRLKETQAINTSLANLGNVIMALANKDSHIPYRNSKLTYLLQNNLGGNSKTLMFVNISPSEDSFNETLNSLRFAAKVNSCHIGTATKRTK